MFTHLRPIFALFVRSLREQSRAKFTPVSRATIALIILLFIVGMERSLSRFPAPGLQLLMMLSMVNFFVIAIFGLSTFASAITEEKEEDTLGLLQMTRLNPLAILLGKSTARLCEGLLLLAVQVPFTMLCITLGGVSMGQILRCYAILGAFLFFLCNVALFWSVVCRRTRTATSMTTFTGLLLYLAPLFMMSLVISAKFRGGVSQSWWEEFAQWAISINPVFDLATTITPRGRMPFSFATDSVRFCLIGGGMSFGLAWLLFRPFCSTSGEAVPRKTSKAVAAGGRRPSRRSRPGKRAIAWKDYHFFTGGLRGLLIRTGVYAVTGFLLAWWIVTLNRGSFREETVGYTLWVMGAISFSTEFGLLSARMFASERKHKTLGTLYALPIGTWQLVRHKILGTLPQLLPSFAIAVFGLTLALSAERSNIGRLFNDEFFAAFFLVLSIYLFFAVLVIYLSLRIRRAPFAAGLCVMLFLYIFFGFTLSSMHIRGSGIEMMIGIALVFFIAAVVIASRIPARIALCAAED